VGGGRGGGGGSAEITMQIYCTRGRNLWPHFRYVTSEAGKYTDKKENQIFLIYKEIQSEAVAKSYMRKGFLKLKYEEMRKYILFGT
jgi:hypothetical protein